MAGAASMFGIIPMSDTTTRAAARKCARMSSASASENRLTGTRNEQSAVMFLYAYPNMLESEFTL